MPRRKRRCCTGPIEEWQFRARVAGGYGTPQAGNLFVTPQGVTGNNTRLKTQTNTGVDFGADWTVDQRLKFSVTGFYEFFRNELVTQSPGAGLQNFTFNAPASEHRGVEVGGDWRFLPGWRFVLAYLYNDQIYTKYREQLSAGGRTAVFNRAGKRIPGVEPNNLLVRLGYDQAGGPRAGIGGFTEIYWRNSFFMENANLLKAPGYAVVNLNLHYDPGELRAGQRREAVLRGRQFVQQNLCRIGQQHRQLDQCDNRARQRAGRIGQFRRVDLCRRAAQLYRRHQSEVLRMSGRRFTSFETRLGIAFGAPQNEGGLLMALKKDLIRRSSRSGRLEGRTMQTGDGHSADRVCSRGSGFRAAASARARAALQRGELGLRDGRLRRSPRMAPMACLSAGGKVMVAHSDDLGGNFAPPVAMKPKPAKIDTGPDARPKIAIDKAGRIPVAYAVFQDQNYNGRVYVAARAMAAQLLSSHSRSPTTTPASASRHWRSTRRGLLVAWIDKRNAAVARSQGKSYPGAALAFSWLQGCGAVAPARIAQDETCECCRLASGSPGRIGRSSRFATSSMAYKGSCGHDIRRCGDTGAGTADLGRRVEDRCLPTPGAGPGDCRRRLSCGLVHQRAGTQGRVLRALGGRRRGFRHPLPVGKDRRGPSVPRCWPRRQGAPYLEGVRWRGDQGQADGVCG